MKTAFLFAPILAPIAALALAVAPAGAQSPAFDPQATTFTGWVKVSGYEFELYAQQRQLETPFSRPCVSGALPRHLQETAADLSGSRVEFTGRAVAWAERGDRQAINHHGSVIANTCGGDHVILAESARVLR